MNTTPTTTHPATEIAVIKETRAHFSSAQAAIQKGCEHAMLAGLRLIWLHSHTSAGRGGDKRSINVSRETLKKGFDSALEEIGIKKATAYRWMDATYKAAVRATLIFDGEELAESLPQPGTPAWDKWDTELKKIAHGMSLNRLMLGTAQASTEDHRYDELLSADEEGRTRASTLLEGVAAGEYTLVQAVRALGSQEAYDALRAEGREKIRKDPVYLKMDGQTGALGGLFVSSLTTLRNTFQHWDETPAPARKAAREMWLAVVTTLPTDLKHG